MWVLAIGAAHAQNNPYVDDKIVHFGFQLGVNFMGFRVDDSYANIDGETYHARVSSMLPGFNVGFISDLRLSNHLNLRFTPGMQFSSRTISFKTESGNPVGGPTTHGNHIDILSIPINIPLYLKWSAEREMNFRPYVIGGGGVSINVYQDREMPILLNRMDYFVEVGAGCDIYLSWFKLCPELTYRIGFANQLDNGFVGPNPLEHFYGQSLNRLLNRQLVLTFNFE